MLGVIRWIPDLDPLDPFGVYLRFYIQRNVVFMKLINPVLPLLQNTLHNTGRLLFPSLLLLAMQSCGSNGSNPVSSSVELSPATTPNDSVTLYFDGDPESFQIEDLAVALALFLNREASTSEIQAIASDVVGVTLSEAQIIGAGSDPLAAFDLNGDGNPGEIEDLGVALAVFLSVETPTAESINTICEDILGLSCNVTADTPLPIPGATPFPTAGFSVQGETVASLAVNGGELLDVTPDGSLAVVVGGTGINLVGISGTSLSLVNQIELPEANFPENSTAAEFTGVSISPDGSFALVGIKDDDDANLDTFNEVPGKVVAVSLPDLTVIGEVTVGIGPDSIDIAPNGQFAAVANEDEEDEENLPSPRAGSVSVIDLSNGPENLTVIEEVAISPEGIPVFPTDPQPETVVISPDSSYILATLQENNAVARIDISSLEPGGFSVVNFDLGQRAGEGFLEGRIGDAPCQSSNGYADATLESFVSSREPDGVAITPQGFFVTADEDNVAVELNGAGIGSPFGARSISVFDASSGAFLGDSGNSIEEAVVGESLPQRCRNKGPEPENLDVGVILGRTLAFTVLERSDAIVIHDVTDPSTIVLLDLVPLVTDPEDPDFVIGNDRSAQLEPEGIKFVPSSNQVVVSNSSNETISLINLTVN
ncbi:MAG: hypothetical protein HC924_03425 [Synechococcaceae cyanobacterium SM2_3_2]|nr:hypothetical protein [Synechococcaceae cyanobacterium SM2_3_2]